MKFSGDDASIDTSKILIQEFIEMAGINGLVMNDLVRIFKTALIVKMVAAYQRG